MTLGEDIGWIFVMDDETIVQGSEAGDGIPRYARIQKILEERLIEGVYPVGSLIPTEIELAAEFSRRRTPTDRERQIVF